MKRVTATPGHRSITISYEDGQKTEKRFRSEDPQLTTHTITGGPALQFNNLRRYNIISNYRIGLLGISALCGG